MDANWFTDPQTYEAALAGPLQRAVDRDLVRSAVRALALKLHLTEGAAMALYNAGVTTEELADALDELVAALPPAPRPLAVMVRAVAYVTRLFPDVRNLMASEQLDGAMGMALVRIMTEEMFPLGAETPDPDAPLRWAATELITFRKLQPSTLSALTVPDRCRLADVLEAHVPLMAALVPPVGANALLDVMDKAATLLRRDPPVDVGRLNAAIGLAP